MPETTDRLEEVKKWLSNKRWVLGIYTRENVEWLVAEVARLRANIDASRAENERLRKKIAGQAEALDTLLKSKGPLKEKIGVLHCMAGMLEKLSKEGE